MATFALIHGAGDVGWYWHLVRAELARLGHDSVAPDLPCDDDSAGLVEYTDAVVAAIGDRRDVIVVGQSLGGFVAPLVCARRPVRRLVLVAPMIPAPGEAPADYWADTGWADEPRAQHDDLFYHDVPADLAAEARKRGRRQSETRLGEPSPLSAWPDVPTKVLLCLDDRLMPPAFVRRVARDRLGVEPEVIPGGHTPALSHPRELAAAL
ncbi:alpha/beta fold hydrolase [Actinoplanes sp. HUAS TT8]|uniref:alpha/beta fold hydrolase n=1 Tax=Actinoplanes sp. HUAS TT8 TaxID=3447453 RepID=UPI003F528A62